MNGILVIGDIMLDKYWFSSSHSLADEAPVAAVSLDNEEYRAGGAANVALNIKKLADDNTEVAILAPIGNDNDGKELSGILSNKGVTYHWLDESHNQTITKHRIISNQQQLLRVDFEQPYQAIQVDNSVKAIIDQYQVIVLSDYNKGSLANIEDIISYAKSKNKLVLVDPKGDDFTKYTGATLLTPNFKEFTNIVGPCEAEQDIDAKSYQLINKLKLDYLVVTQGSKGMSVYADNSYKYHASAYAEEVYDVTGAGDTVLASIAVGLAEGLEIDKIIELASHAAALVVNQVGTGFIARQEVEQFIARKKSVTNILSKASSKIIEINTQEEIGQLQNKNNCYHWDYVKNNILTAESIRNLKQRFVTNKDKLTIVIINNIKPARCYHSIDELVYMLGNLSIVDEIIYSKKLDLSTVFNKSKVTELEGAI